MIKIAVAGKMGAGKNEFFKLACQLFGGIKFEERKFASKMYECMYTIQNILGIEVHKDGAFLQFIGQHYQKQYGSNFWVDQFFVQYEGNLSQYTSHPFKDRNIIITDLRFPAEFEACKKHGFKTVRIDRKRELRLESIGNRDPNHISETALDSVPNAYFDYVINNNGSLSFFEGAIIQIIEDIQRKHK